MNIFFIAAAILIVALIFFYRRKKLRSSARETQVSSQSTRAPQPQLKTDFWGVELRFPDPEKCCQQALSIQNEQFPKERARPLPLPGCNQRTCRCYYEKLAERRSGKERRQQDDRRSAIRFEDKPDRRSHVDRRKSSAAWHDDRH